MTEHNHLSEEDHERVRSFAASGFTAMERKPFSC